MGHATDIHMLKERHPCSLVIHCKCKRDCRIRNILIQLVFILVGMMITPGSPHINIIHSLVRHKKTVRILLHA